MKSEKGFIRLLIICEIGVLTLVLVFGVVKQLGKKDEPADYEANSQKVENEIAGTLSTETEMETECETESEVEEQIVFSEEVMTRLSNMTLEQKLAQLFIVAPETLTHTDRVTIAGRGTQNALSSYPVGGMLYARRNYQGQAQMRELIEGAQEMSMEICGLYLFAASLVETDEGVVIAFSNDNSAEPITELMIANGDSNGIEGGRMQLLPLSTYTETVEVNQETLMCISVQNADEAIYALQNGMDILCVTEDFETIYSAVVEAVNAGTIGTDRIERAVGKILTQKLAMME